MPSIDHPEVEQIQGEENWIALIVAYLKEGRLLEKKRRGQKVKDQIS